MDNREARAILALFRAGDPDLTDARFREAEAEASANPELAQWWAAEQELDAAIARRFQELPVPAGLKARLLAGSRWPNEYKARRWQRRILLAAAAIAALAVIFGSWRGPFQPAASLANYRDEMTSFIKVAPSLEMQSDDLGRIVDFLKESGMPAGSAIPEKLRAMEPVGCRVLRFRGHDVALICFKRGQGKLMHLFVVNRAAIQRPGAGAGPEFAAMDDWMTAAWQQGEQICLLMSQSDRAQLEKFLPEN